MNFNKPIFTEKNDCQDCYKCVRNCPVKAIRIANNCASVIDELCISCGKCVEVCPVGAKKVRSDAEIIKLLINHGKKVVLSLAPSWTSNFPGVSTSSIIKAMKDLGFYAVSETALGAEMVNRYTRNWLSNNNVGVSISSACPVVVDLINRHYPQYTNYIQQVASPLISHTKYLKETFGNDIHIAFAGPCIAKKNEADRNSNLLDASITFYELEHWMDDEMVEIDPKPQQTYHFEPVEAVSGAIYPVDGGMIAGINSDQTVKDVSFMSFSGIDAVKQVLNDMQQWQPNSNVFIELLACSGGCINGPSTKVKTSIALRHNCVQNLVRQKNTDFEKNHELFSEIDLKYNQNDSTIAEQKKYTESDIIDAMRAVGKQSTKDELNCGGCGYDSCREFAIAMLDGKAEQNMCVSYMRRVAHDKSTVLLQRMPSGVIIVDENLKVIECNQNVARMLGEEVSMIYDTDPGMAGASLEKLLTFHKMFSTVLATGKDLLNKEVRTDDHMLKVSIFTIQAHKIVGAIIRNLNNPDVRNDEIVSKAKSVIKENLETVQQIAYLLGENASKSETMLNSIMDLFKENRSNDGKDISY